jgi:hypothetical protein
LCCLELIVSDRPPFFIVFLLLNNWSLFRFRRLPSFLFRNIELFLCLRNRFLTLFFLVPNFGKILLTSILFIFQVIIVFLSSRLTLHSNRCVVWNLFYFQYIFLVSVKVVKSLACLRDIDSSEFLSFSLIEIVFESIRGYCSSPFLLLGHTP